MISSEKRDQVSQQAMKLQPSEREAHANDYPDFETLPVPLARKVEANCVVLVNGCDVTPEPVRWLWEGWLARGKLHILGGAPGQGKTTIALNFAATVTAGEVWPDGTSCESGNVLIWSGEDDPADTLLPRLLAAGADRSRCYFVSGTRINGEVRSFDPSKDIAALEAQAISIGGVKLLMVDPVVSAVLGDGHKNAEVRRDLQPIVDLASRLDCAAIGITHFSKGGSGSDPALRLSGSIAFAAVARVVMVVAKVSGEDGGEKRILARAKSNIGPDDGGFEYRIDQAEPIPDISASFISWGKAVTGTATELLAEPEGRDGYSAPSAVQLAAEFLQLALASGKTPVKKITSEAKAARISWPSIKRASEKLGIIKTKGSDAWYWKLPNLLNQVANSVQPENLEHVEHVEHVAVAEPRAFTDFPRLEIQDDQEAQGAQLLSQGQVEHVGRRSSTSGTSATDFMEF